MQNITLYTHPFSCGTYVVWMLKECGAEYTAIPIQFGGQIKSADYLAINPQGQVPALKFSTTVLTETAARLPQVTHLALIGNGG
ncbi:MAG: glutathione S-transferase N-terminal domain-containing protein, partial [Lautropia sp.]|nr:glutathione S-transferase N-terminal domain-containing protein [Lautropia sp.]